MSEVWERQPKEPQKAYAAFAVYRDMPPRTRSITRSVRLVYGDGTTRAKIGQHQVWSARYDWVQRAAAWDAERDAAGRETQLAAIREMHRIHAVLARNLLNKARLRLESLDPESLTAADVRQYIIDAARLERGARGEPETLVATMLPRNFVVDIGGEVNPPAPPDTPHNTDSTPATPRDGENG